MPPKGSIFLGITTTANYPANNVTWTEEVLQQYGGTVTWVPMGGEIENPFTDVPANSYFKTPVLWALKQGITGGTSATTFSPSKACTRAQVVTFLYQAYGKT